MSKEIKQNLFKFVTVRNPQLIDKKENHPGFVFHPNEGSSAFVKAIEGVREAEKAAKLQEKAATFSAYKTRTDVRKQNEGLYKFSSWLMRNKNGLSYKAIKDNLNGATPLGNLKLTIWENLIYQTVTKKSVHVREALIQMLIADQFLVAFNTFSASLKSDIVFTVDQEELFTRRACASVVITKSLFSDEVKPRVAKPRRITEAQERAMLKAVEIETAKSNVEVFRKLDSELKEVEAKSNKALQKEYDAALIEYNANVDKITDAATPVLVEETDPKTGEKRVIESYPDLKLPKFKFTKRKTVNEGELNRVLSNEAMDVFKKQELGIYEEFSEVYEQINTKIKNETQVIIDNEEGTTPKTVLVGGVKTAVSSNKLRLDPYCFFVSNLSAINNPGLNMFLGTGYSGVQVSNVSYELANLDSGVKIAGTTAQVNGGLDNTSARLFFPINQLLSNTASYRFSGTFTLNNGVTLRFDVTNDSSKKRLVFNGCCEIVKGDDTTPVDIEKPEIYGVTSLGIADFRRVEQEVCCYVPGEVSHIENIMAREYKERSTRSLTSIENTTEETSEKEVENLTDTTTTERNEMQSEVATVLNEDKSTNFGANASVSGKTPGGNITFGAGAYFDASTSSSTSNSNSQAQTYAQEVTERAMERIVQKVSRKRTSRILREFEENNTHGFDNRKGDKHITGVYRWVDKIYKNKLINYGKRLMYEFAIPEPARFFKEAIYKSLEDGTDTTSAVILPEAPKPLSYYGIEHAGFLHEGNYQYYAAKYGAEVSAAPEYYSYVGTSLTKSQQGGDGDRLTNKASKEVIKVPKGYKATAAKTSGKQHSGQVQVTVAGLNLGVNSGNFVGIWPYYREEVPVSGYFNLNWVTNVNVVVRCERTDAYYNEWKNETYNAIIEAYNDRLREYNEATLAKELEANTGDREKLSFNPLLNRSIEKRELKRIAIELLIEQSKVSKDNYNPVDESTGLSTVKKNEGLQDHASTVKFFEQAFDWEIMAYIFYPYFYAKEADWKALFQSQDAADPIFQAFLQSGMARTVIPVRPGFEDAINWYMSTGEIWNGEGLIIDQDNDLYVSIAEEMETIEGEVEKTWETRLPTSLTVLQAGSIGLNVEGLPCNTDCDDFALFDSDGNPIFDSEGNPLTDNPIQQTNTLIGGEDGVVSDASQERKTVEFSFTDNSGSYFTNIGEYDGEQAFPLVFTCMGQKIEIHRDATWNGNTSSGVIYQKLAEEISLIPGVEAKQMFSKKGEPLKIQFQVDIEKVPTFTFERFTEKGSLIDPNYDVLKISINEEALKVTAPKDYLDRIADKSDTMLSNSDLNANLPIDRFLV
ncbi:hypothetical protein [Pontimicrobium sp. MEBiC01747]